MTEEAARVWPVNILYTARLQQHTHDISEMCPLTTSLYLEQIPRVDNEKEGDTEVNGSHTGSPLILSLSIESKKKQLAATER